MTNANMTNTSMTNAKTKLRLQNAAVTLARLPRSYLDRPGRPQSGWPEMQRTARLCVDGTRAPGRPVPSPRAIDDMNQVIDALYSLSPAARRLLWARACGLPWAQLQIRLGGSRTHLNRRYRLALTSLTTQLDPLAGLSGPCHPAPLNAMQGLKNGNRR